MTRKGTRGIATGRLPTCRDMLEPAGAPRREPVDCARAAAGARAAGMLYIDRFRSIHLDLVNNSEPLPTTPIHTLGLA